MYCFYSVLDRYSCVNIKSMEVRLEVTFLKNLDGSNGLG